MMDTIAKYVFRKGLKGVGYTIYNSKYNYSCKAAKTITNKNYTHFYLKKRPCNAIPEIQMNNKTRKIYPYNIICTYNMTETDKVKINKASFTLLLYEEKLSLSIAYP